MYKIAKSRARRDACRIRLHEAAEKIPNVDGAPWIRNQIRGQSLPLHAVGLDFYHLAEHVHPARRAVFGEDDTTGDRRVNCSVPTSTTAPMRCGSPDAT